VVNIVFMIFVVFDPSPFNQSINQT